MWVSHFAARHALVRPGALALADGERGMTWAELDGRARALAASLAGRGAGTGSRMLVLSRNRVEVPELYLAAAHAGAVVCPVNPAFPAPELAYIAGSLEPVAVFGEPDALARLGPAAGTAWQVELGSPEYEQMAAVAPREFPVPAAGDVFAILQTSATSGRPKGVMVSHRSIMACYTGMAAHTGMSAADVMLNPCPFFHGSMVIGLALLAAGGTLVLPAEFSPQRVLADIERLGVTRVFLVPSMIRFIMQARSFGTAELGSLREVMWGGSAMTEELLTEAQRRFPCGLRNVYGITEGGGPIALLDPEDVRTGGERLRSAGRMMPGAHIRILDDDGRPLPPGEVGEVCVRGDGLMTGYWRNPQATAEAIRDGWLRTGDLGYADSAGYLYLVDRRSDMILRGGQNVYPAEIERVLRRQPSVADVAAVGQASADWGEVPVAFVVPAGEQPRESALIAACTRELASYKRPVAIHLVAEIPRNAAGKVLRKELRRRLDEAAATPAGRPAGERVAAPDGGS